MIILIIILLCIPYIIDIWINTRNFYKRLKIGRYTDIDQWETKIIRVAEKWIKKTPIIKKTDNARFIILDIIKGNYRSSTIQSWQTGLVYLAVSERKKVDYSKIFINKNGEWINKPQEIDFSLLAYAILKNSQNKNAIKKSMDEMYELIISCQQSNDGCISYRKQFPEERYVDTVGFVAPFLSYYGLVYRDNYAIDLAIKVIKEYYKNGFHADTLLPVHAYDSNTLAPLGIYGWGRGTGWYLLGIIDTYNSVKNSELLHIIQDLAEKYKEYQRDDGSFGCIVQLKNIADSSATSVFAYFYACCASIFNNIEYYHVSQNAIKYLMTVTRRNGEIDFSQGDTKGIGFYSTTFDIMPFTQGMACRAVYWLKEKCKFNE